MTTETLMTEPADEAATTEGAEGQPPAEGQQPTGDEQGGKDDAATVESDQGGDKAEGEEGEGKDGKKDDEKSEGPPEQYEFEAPEGVEYDDKVIEAYSETARELGLSQEDAQKLLDGVTPVMNQRTAERLDAARAEWTESAQKDEEFGGEKLQENLAVAKTALDQFGTPELQSLLNESGLGSHPEMIRAFYRAGKAMSEDQFVNGQTRSAQGGDARSLYSASNMNP
ncbi:hypothetical protein [Guyparkeria halopsychrophila]|uniref:hypothetical protein n=1 Tax=Guyparkeria halopsychrophila TaxID=3139421 RepID=UPI0037CC3C6D